MVETYPLLPLRDIVVFPGMVVPLFVGRDKSVAALEAAVGAWGATPSQAAYAATLWRWTALQICAQQLHAAQQCSASDAALLRLAL